MTKRIFSGAGVGVMVAIAVVLGLLTAVIVASNASSPSTSSSPSDSGSASDTVVTPTPSETSPSDVAPPADTGPEDLGLQDDTDGPTTTTQVLPPRCLDGEDTLPSRPGPCAITSYGAARPTVVLWGDSHAWQQLPALEAEARRTRTNLVTFLMGACPPMDLRGQGYRSSCAQQSEQALDYVTTRQQRAPRVTLVLGGFWELYRSYHARAQAGWTPTDPHDRFLLQQADLFAAGGDRLFDTLARRGVVTAAIAQAPWVGEEAAACAAGEEPYACSLPRSTAIPQEQATATWLQRQLAGIRGADYLDTSRFVCSPTTCRPELGGQPVYLDELHLDPAVTDRFAPEYRALFS